MSKLGLIIKVTAQGETESFSVNKNTWSRYAIDARSIITGLGGFNKTGKKCVFVKFLGREGFLIGAVIANPANTGRDFDNTTAWIHVPVDAAITGAELADVVNQVFSAFGALSTDTAKLNVIFSKEYPARTCMPAFATIQSSGVQTGIVYYGTNYSFPELLGDYLAQQAYVNYKAVVFAEQSQGISCPNVVPANFRKSCTITIPSSNDGFIPYINGTPVNGEVEVCEGQLAITWRRQGFKDVQKVYPITQSTPISPLNPSEHRRLIDLGKLRISEKSGAPIKAVDSIRVNGMKANVVFDISEQEYITKGLKVEITKNGFEPFSKHFRTVEELYAEPIRMNRRMNEYDFVLKINGRDAEVKVLTSERLSESPFKSCKALGTVQPNRQIRLEQSEKVAGGWFGAKLFVGFFAGILLTVLGVLGYNAITGMFEKPQPQPSAYAEGTEDPQTDEENQSEDDQENANPEATVNSGTNTALDEYLNSLQGDNKAVTREKLEKCAPDLYDAMVTFNKKKVLEIAGNVTNPEFKKIIDAMQNFEPTQGANFHGSQDKGTIVLNQYLKALGNPDFNVLIPKNAESKSETAKRETSSKKRSSETVSGKNGTKEAKKIAEPSKGNKSKRDSI